MKISKVIFLKEKLYVKENDFKNNNWKNILFLKCNLQNELVIQWACIEATPLLQ
jgi:hypothetical protein